MLFALEYCYSCFLLYTLANCSICLLLLLSALYSCNSCSCLLLCTHASQYSSSFAYHSILLLLSLLLFTFVNSYCYILLLRLLIARNSCYSIPLLFFSLLYTLDCLLFALYYCHSSSFLYISTLANCCILLLTVLYSYYSC